MLDVISLILFVFLVVVAVWLVLTIQEVARRLLRSFDAMGNTLDDMKRALQALNSEIHSVADLLEDDLRKANDTRASTQRVLGDIREAMESMKRR
jgi:predicted PurR-regulated permease PerM